MKLGPSFFSLIVLLAMCQSSFALITARTRDAIDKARGRCDKSVQASQKEFGETASSMLSRYSRDLTSLEKSVKKAGDLKGLVAVRKEVERFKEDGTITPAHVTADFPRLKNLQLKYARYGFQIDVQSREAILDAFQKCSVALRQLEEGLLKDGKASEAGDVKEERVEVMTAEVHTKADFELAEIQMQNQELLAALKSEKSPPSGGERRSPRGTSRRKKEQWESFGGEGSTVYPLGTPSSKLAEGNFKDISRLLVHPDRLMAQRSQLGISAMLAEETSQYRKKVWRYGKQVDARYPTTVTRTFVRIEASGKSRSSAVLKPTLLIVYFSNRLDSRVHEEAGRDVIRLPNFEGRSKAVIDTRGLRTETDIQLWTDGDRGERKKTVGNECYGFTVSLFEGTGKLILQAVSDRTLMKDLPTSLPDE